jgi:hypothetical protein
MLKSYALGQDILAPNHSAMQIIATSERKEERRRLAEHFDM